MKQGVSLHEMRKKSLRDRIVRRAYESQRAILRTARCIRIMRKKAGLTQKELGQKIGVSQPAIAHFERGRRSITLVRLARIASACGQSIAITTRRRRSGRS